MKNTEGLPEIANVEDSEKGVIKKKVTTRDLEIWECAQLSSNFAPKSKPSDLFRKLEERRKERHENRMKQLAKDLNEINQKTEMNIKISSKEVKAHMKYFSDQLKDILTNIDKPEVASYCSSVFLDFQNKANDFKTQQQKLVDELYDDLIKFENDRAKENEQVFHTTCEELRKIGYILPYELQTFVEHKVMEMNQLSLNNRRCYCDLRLSLTLVTEDTFKSFINKVFCIREKWVQLKAQEAVFDLQSDTENEIARLPSEEYSRLEVKGLELTVELSPDNLHSICKTEEWSKNVTEILEMIEIHGSNIIDLYRKTLDAVYRSFDDEVEDIRKQLSSVEMLTIEERVIKPILFEVKSDQWKEIENLEVFWQENLYDIKSTLEEATEFLMDVGTLWDRHTERLCESKKLILRALEKAEENNQTVFQELEVKLNIALDSLRQEHVKSKLDKAHEAVVSILDLIKAKYESSYLEDVDIVKDYYQMMAIEADVLSAELKEFIYVSYIMTNIRTGPFACEQYRAYPERKLICKEIQICAHKVKAVKSWKSGVWIAMENLALKTGESLEPRAEVWVRKKIGGLAEVMSIQMELLERRFERIKIEFYEKRSEEVDCHQKVYDQHRENIKAVYQKMKQDLADLTERESKKLSEIENNFREIEESVKLESSPGIVLSNKILIQRKQDETQNELKTIFERFRVDCEIKMADLRQSNVDFMKEIKLFHEDGNYSAEEGKMFITLLEGIDKEMNADLKNFVKDVAKDEGELMKKCSLAFTPIINLLSLMYEETLFIHDIRERLKDVAEDIRELAGRLKSDFEVLKDQANCFSECYDSDELLKGNQKRLWSVLFDSLYKNVSNLFYPVKLPVTPVESVEEEEEEVGEYSSLEEKAGVMTPCFGLTMLSTKVTISATPTFRTLEKKENLTCKDFRGLLFGGEDPPEKDGTFMGIISNRLWVEMDILQKAACNFYKKVGGRKLIKEDMIPVNYESFADDVLTKFRLYNVQCEQLWLRLILDFLPIFGQIKWTVYQFLDRTIQKYGETMMEALKTYHDDFVSCLEGQSCKTRELFDALDNKLMPLHGYPQNKSLLDELEEEVVERTAGLGIEWDGCIKKFKNRLKYFRCYHIKNRIEVDKIQITFNKMKEKIFVEYLGSSLLDAVVEWTTRGGFLTCRSSKESLMEDGEENSVASGDVPDNYRLYLNSVDGKLHSVKTYLRDLKELVEVERSKDSDTNDGSDDGKVFHTKGIGLKLNVLLELPDFEEWVAKILERVEGELKMMKTLAESKENVHEEALFKWLNVWKYNVKKVRKLYSVRYEERPKSPEEVATTGKS